MVELSVDKKMRRHNVTTKQKQNNCVLVNCTCKLRNQNSANTRTKTHKSMEIEEFLQDLQERRLETLGAISTAMGQYAYEMAEYERQEEFQEEAIVQVTSLCVVCLIILLM